MGLSKQMKKQKEVKKMGRKEPLTQAEMDEAIAAEKARKETESKSCNTLWGEGTPYDTQADYQRACMGGKFSK